MEKSIESIWKEGFLRDDALVAPQVNNLYKRKSLNIIDRIIRLGKINLYALAGFSAVLMVLTYMLGIPWLGVFMFVALNGIALVGFHQLKSVKHVQQNDSSYNYLHNFNDWLNHRINYFERFYKKTYPILFLGMFLGTWFSDYHDENMQKLSEVFPGMVVVWGIPLVGYGILAAVALLIYIFAAPLYRFDIKMVYGRVFKKLNEIIRDMEELRKDVDIVDKDKS